MEKFRGIQTTPFIFSIGLILVLVMVIFKQNQTYNEVLKERDFLRVNNSVNNVKIHGSLKIINDMMEETLSILDYKLNNDTITVSDLIKKDTVFSKKIKTLHLGIKKDFKVIF